MVNSIHIKHKNKKQVKITFYISMMIVVLVGFSLFVTYNALGIIKQDKINSEWDYILTILENNENKSEIQADLVKDDIIKDVNVKYTTKDQLKYDLENITTDNQISRIFNNDINGKYINVDNDNNDMFVLTTWDKNSIDIKGKIIYDKSVNCATYGEIKTLDAVLSMSYNYNLGYDAFKRIMNQDKDKPIFMEYLPSNNPNHKMIEYCSIDQLKDVYINEGIEGLKTYEILNPVYINDKDDLLGNVKITNTGIHNDDNRQLVLVQGFSLYDALKYTSDFSRLNEISDRYITLENLLQFGIVTFSIIFIIIIINVSKIQNLATEIEDLQLKINQE